MYLLVRSDEYERSINSFQFDQSLAIRISRILGQPEISHLSANTFIYLTAKGLRWDYGIYQLGFAILGCPSATISFAELEADPSMNGFAKWQTANGLRKNPKAVVLGAKCED